MKDFAIFERGEGGRGKGGGVGGGGSGESGGRGDWFERFSCCRVFWTRPPAMGGGAATRSAKNGRRVLEGSERPEAE